MISFNFYFSRIFKSGVAFDLKNLQYIEFFYEYYTLYLKNCEKLKATYLPFAARRLRVAGRPNIDRYYLKSAHPVAPFLNC